jgi:hypothetical protein
MPEHAKTLPSRADESAYIEDQINQVCIYDFVTTEDSLIIFIIDIGKSNSNKLLLQAKNQVNLINNNY